MIFTTYWFCLFAGVFFVLYWSIPVPVARFALLLVSCAVFHTHFAGAAGVVPIVILALLTYGAGLWRRRWGLYATMTVLVAALIFYKYSHFIAIDLIGSVNADWGRRLDAGLAHWLPAAPPLAVSFFTFEFVHYLYDVSKGSPSIRNPAHFGAFTFYFPSLVAGPIKRYQPFMESLQSGLQRVPLDDIKLGLVRVGVGLVKKVIIADNLTAAIDFWQPRFAELSILGRWELVGALGLRILMDFSGYSDIAIGLGLMMGIRLPENFNWPYFATNLSEFWHRWHISLSSWIRDYIYIPLGGNRHGYARKAMNAIVAFGLCGLWHGAAWNFVLWGLYHGLGLAISANYRAVLGAPGRAIGSVFTRVPLLGWLVTTLFVFFGWLLFFYPVPQAWRMAGLLFGAQP